MTSRDPNVLIRELLLVSRELQQFADDEQDLSSVTFLRGRRDMLLVALRAHMRRYEADEPLPSADFSREPSGVRTKSGAWAGMQAPSRRKARR